MQTVLIIEHNVFLQDMWADLLRGRVQIIPAYSIGQAEGEFDRNEDLAVIVVNACMSDAKDGAHEHEMNTVPLVEKIRAEFKGPMIAISGIPSFRQKLVEAGCNHWCEKQDLSRKVCEILGLMQ